MPRAPTKHEAVAERITAGIAAGRWRAGERLPSEEEFARTHKVSVGTIQKALAALARQGAIRREHGSGTYVSGRDLAPADVRFLQFRDARGRTLPLTVRVLRSAPVRGPGPWSRFLGQRACVRIDRLFEIGPRVRLASEFYLRAEDHAALLEAGIGGAPRTPHRALGEDNLREALERRLSLPTLRVEQLVRVSGLPARSARLLGLDARRTGFAMELYGHTVRDRPLYYQRVFGGPFRDSLVIVRDSGAAAPGAAHG
ncbi:MAG: GntR family transcriptional regulator [Burkholderiales bacterium]|nr:GntR family transcriptional regulator [Burkholderiales bacterium]